MEFSYNATVIKSLKQLKKKKNTTTKKVGKIFKSIVKRASRPVSAGKAENAIKNVKILWI